MGNDFSQFKDALQTTINSELDGMMTFSPEMADHIQEVYRNLREQRRLWLEEQQRKREEQS